MTTAPQTPEPDEEEWPAEEIAAYRAWIFTPDDGNLDTSSEDWLANVQEKAFHSGFNAGRTQALEEAARIAEKAWDEGFAAADINRPRSRQGHWDNTRHGIRTWVPDPLPVNPYRAAAIQTGDKP